MPAPSLAKRKQRFLEKTKHVENGCWEWRGRKSDNGYGLIIVDKKNTRTHRVAWEYAYGAIPNGKWVLHHCDNRCCVRPDHLFLGDNAANVRDMHSKGRGRHRINPEIAYAILWRSAAGSETLQQIADAYDVGLFAVKDISRFRTWRSLQELHD
jgi:hypothetical protein